MVKDLVFEVWVMVPQGLLYHHHHHEVEGGGVQEVPIASSVSKRPREFFDSPCGGVAKVLLLVGGVVLQNFEPARSAS